MIEIDLYNQLKNDTSVSDLVGTRIYPKVAPQNVTTPYIVYHVVNDIDNQCLSGDIYQNDTRFQVDIWGKKYSEVKQLKTAVKSSISKFKSSYDLSSMDDYEKDTELYRELLDFKLKG